MSEGIDFTPGKQERLLALVTSKCGMFPLHGSLGWCMVRDTRQPIPPSTKFSPSLNEALRVEILAMEKTLAGSVQAATERLVAWQDSVAKCMVNDA